MGRIAVVQTTSSKESRKRLEAFAAGKPYLVRVKGLAGGKIVDESVEVTSIGAGFDATSQWEDVERRFNEARCAVSNTADRGYETDPSDRPDAGPPRSFPAKLAKLLLARHRAGAGPITLFPCELTPANGNALRAAVLGVLDRWEAPAKARRWIEDRVRLGQFARRPHCLRTARAGRRCGRALCALGDRGPARPRASLPSRLDHGDRRSQAFRAVEAVHSQPGPYVSRGDLGARRRRADADCPRGDGG